MPVRKIPRTAKSVRGQFPSVKNGRSVGFESTLERDFYLGLEFDKSVKCYEEQPIRLVGTIEGRKIVYVPDCQITYWGGKPQLLAEVKRAEDIQRGARGLLDRIELARRHAEDNNMGFRVFTEVDICTPNLETQRFIYGFSTPPRELVTYKVDMLAIVSAAREISLQQLLESLSKDRTAQARFSPIIWHLLFTGELIADFSRPISYATSLRLSNECTLA
jgi:hypothetical protein